MKNLYLILSSIILSVLTFFLVYKQLFTNAYESDTFEHVIFLYRYIYEDGFYIAHPLWHISSFIISKLLFIPVQYGAIIASVFYVVLWYILVYLFIKHKLHSKFNTATLVSLSIITIIIGPLCIPWYNHVIFFGQGSPNTWHNVTLWTVKPFALLSVWFILDGLNQKNKNLLFWGILFTLISIFAKPSFIIMFLPALLIYAFALKIYKDRTFIITYGILGLLSIAILLYQYTHTFNQEEGKIIIDFLGVWSLSSPNILISIFLALAFPLLFTILKTDILNDRYILISWIMIFISIVYYATFAQSGRFYSHGNFGWSYIIAMSLLYLFSIVKFCKIFYTLLPIKRYFLIIILLLQVIIGIYYFIHILMGQNPLYIAIFL